MLTWAGMPHWRRQQKLSVPIAAENAFADKTTKEAASLFYHIPKGQYFAPSHRNPASSPSEHQQLSRPSHKKWMVPKSVEIVLPYYKGPYHSPFMTISTQVIDW